MHAIPDERMDLRIRDPVIGAAWGETGKAIGSDPLRGAAATFDLAPGADGLALRWWKGAGRGPTTLRTVIRGPRLEEPFPDGRSGC